MITCEEWLKKGYLKKLNTVLLKEEERRDLEIRGYRKYLSCKVNARRSVYSPN